MATGNREALRTVLMDVIVDGAVVIPHRKLLAYLGRKGDTATVWQALLKEWVDELEQEREALWGLGVKELIVLCMSPYEGGEFCKISEWADKD